MSDLIKMNLLITNPRNRRKHMNEFEKFFDGLPSADQKFEGAPETMKAPEEGGEAAKTTIEPTQPTENVHKNRRHRRLEEQLEKERIEKATALAELDAYKKAKAVGAEINLDPRLLRAFGTTDEGKEVARLFSEVLNEKTSAAKEEALREYEGRQAEAAKEQTKMEEFIESEFEALEDEHGIDLTSDAPAARKARRELLEIVEKLSPKDENGEPTAYADFGASFEMYQKTKVAAKEAPTRQKEIAARSMQQSGQGAGSEKRITPGFRGWMTDYNVN